MHDLISRQSAIDALGDKPLAWTEGEYELGLQNQWQSDIDALKALPPAQPERKRGKWINVNEGKWNVLEVLKCSTCGEIDNRMYRTDSYCPNCGADMRGGDEDGTD